MQLPVSRNERHGYFLALRLAPLLAMILALALGPLCHSATILSRDQVAFAVIGDFGTGGEGEFRIASQMAAYHNKVPFDFVLTLGDNIYPSGKPELFKPRFEEPFKELLNDGVKVYASLGNHDVTKGMDAELHYDKFHMDGHRYYTFSKDNGLIDFFALDSTSMNGEQLSWLEELLKTSTARWKVAFFHHPIYSSARFHGSDLKLRRVLEPLLARYHVDAVFAGHDHVYERTRPQQGVRYFTEGASGQLRSGDLNRGSGFFEAGNDSVNSFLIVEVDRDHVKVQAVSETGEVLDSVSIEKGKP